jgi:hypothetical protein
MVCRSRPAVAPGSAVWAEAPPGSGELNPRFRYSNSRSPSDSVHESRRVGSGARSRCRRHVISAVPTSALEKAVHGGVMTRRVRAWSLKSSETVSAWTSGALGAVNLVARATKRAEQFGLLQMKAKSPGTLAAARIAIDAPERRSRVPLAKELARGDVRDFLRPPAERRLQHPENGRLVLCHEGSHVDGGQAVRADSAPHSSGCRASGQLRSSGHSTSTAP